jgi:hypothetical protein
MGVRVAAMVAAIALVAGVEARADIEFDYGTQVTPNPYLPSGGDMVSQLNQISIGNFTNPSLPAFVASGVNGTNITVAQLQIEEVNGTAPFNDLYGPQTVTVQLKILDNSSGLTGTFTFMGQYTEAVEQQFVSSSGTGTASDFNNPWTLQSQKLQIGNNVYTVSIIPSQAFTAPNPPDIATGFTPPDRLGSFVFNVRANPVPEPSTFALLGIGLVGTVAVYRRRRTS